MIALSPTPVIVIDDTPIKRRGICEFVAETRMLTLMGQAGNADDAMQLVETSGQGRSSALDGWLILSDLRLGDENGIDLGRTLLEVAPELHVVIYTQDPSWTLAAEVFRHAYTRKRTPRLNLSTGKATGLHGYALFPNIEPTYLESIVTTVMHQHETFVDSEVLDYLLKRLHGQHLTPRQQECASLITLGLSNDEIALRMGFLNAQGKPNIGPLENLVSELYNFFSIDGASSDPGRRVLLAHAYEAYIGQRR
ncbi:MAG TPA: hypothetical protein VHZ51_10255 [Ktedonobacteraceae bacterium]|nr:hypothetical protein [Ktedonobacteraceae bacterium]